MLAICVILNFFPLNLKLRKNYYAMYEGLYLENDQIYTNFYHDSLTILRYICAF